MDEEIWLQGWVWLDGGEEEGWLQDGLYCFSHTKPICLIAALVTKIIISADANHYRTILNDSLIGIVLVRILIECLYVWNSVSKNINWMSFWFEWCQ